MVKKQPYDTFSLGTNSSKNYNGSKKLKRCCATWLFHNSVIHYVSQVEPPFDFICKISAFEIASLVYLQNKVC